MGYFHLINAVAYYVFYDDVQWIKRGWINRHTINQNSNEEKLTLSVKKHSTHALINEVEIADFAKINYLNKIETIYRKAPYFKYHISFITDLINCGSYNMAELAENSIKEIASLLDIKTEFESAVNINNNKNLKGEQRVIDMCKVIKSKTYINNINGRNLYNKQNFLKENINLLFFEKVIVPYKQFNDLFIPYLSIVDVLMFNDLETVKEMVRMGNLICP